MSEFSGTYTIREAQKEDTFAIQKVYQLADESLFDTAFFSNYQRIQNSFNAPDQLWMVLEHGGQIVGFAWCFVDRSQRIAKISRLLVSFEDRKEKREKTRAFLKLLIDYIGALSCGIDILWANSRPLDQDQNLPAELGFKVLGIFPNGKEEDHTLVTALIAYFYDKTLEKDRIKDNPIHPSLKNLYNIARDECELPEVTISPLDNPPEISLDSPKRLELIKAKSFVEHRFDRLKKRNFLSTTFYPFHRPNTLITNPEQSIELFVRVFPAQKMATVVAERIELDVDPIKVYQQVCRILKDESYNYIEVINDAGDVWGCEYLMKAGFVPCCYFPSLKKHNNRRRDYVVLARSYEHFVYPKLELDPIYINYLVQYHQLASELHQILSPVQSKHGMKIKKPVERTSVHTDSFGSL